MINLSKYDVRIDAYGKLTVYVKKTGQICDSKTTQKYLQEVQHVQNLYDSKKDCENEDAADSRSCKDFFRIGHIAREVLHRHIGSLKRLMLVDWIVDHMKPATNKLKCTYSFLAKNADINRATIAKTYKILKATHLAKIHSGCVFINPELVMRGSDERYCRIYEDYYNSSEAWWKHPDTNDEYTYKFRNMH